VFEIADRLASVVTAESHPQAQEAARAQLRSAGSARYATSFSFSGGRCAGCLQFADVFVEAIQLGFPKWAIVFEPFGRFLQRLRREAARPRLRLSASLDQPRALEDFQVLRYGR
jgi:hypothetical protein